MKMTADYHTHTIYSHGKGTVEENVLEALAKGLDTICISEHGSGHLLYGVKKDRLLQLKNEILQLREKYPAITILFGIEANIINYDGTIDVEAYLDIFDVVLVGMHYMIRFNKFAYYYGTNFLSRYLGLFRDYCRRRNTDILLNCITRYDNIFAITHPGERFFIDAERLSRACVNKGIAMEINNGHGYMNVHDASIAAKNGARLLVSSDAHRAEDVGTFDKCEKIIFASGIDIKQILNIKEA